MAKVDPLNGAEEAFWRALMRIVLSLPVASTPTWCGPWASPRTSTRR
jgi:hypothetical protein